MKFFQLPAFLESHKTKYSGSVRLLDVRLQLQRLEKRISEANVRQPRVVIHEINAQCEMIELWPFAATVSRHPRRKQRDRKTKLAQQRGERAIQLVTESSPPIRDNFPQQRIFVEHDSPSQGNIEILKGDGQHVRVVDGAKGAERGRSRPNVADAREVRRNINHAEG